MIPLAGAEDVCRVAATLLADPGLPTQTVYPLVSEAVTVKEMMGTLSRMLGRTVRYVPVTDEQWADAVKERLNPHALDHLSHLWQHYRVNAQTYHRTDTVRVATGHNPETLEEFFRANLDAMTRGDH